MHVFPKWFYHPEKIDGLIVHSQAQLDGLGEGWVHSTADFPPKEEPADTYQEHMEKWESKEEKKKPSKKGKHK